MMEWRYVFDDEDNTIDSFLILWKANIEILIANREKIIIVMDTTRANLFSIQKIMKIISFISSNKRKLSETTEKVQIIAATDKQVRSIKSAMGLSPVRICEFEIIKNVADV